MNGWVWFLLELLSVLAFAQAFIWLNNARYKGPKGALRVRQILSQLKLETNGFEVGQIDTKRKNGVISTGGYYEGWVDDYPVDISFEPSTGWVKHPYYIVRVCLSGFSDVTANGTSKIKRESCNWVESNVTIGKFGHPSGESLLDVARELIKDATRN